MEIYPIHVENRSLQHGQKEKTEAGLCPATLYKNYGFHPRCSIATINPKKLKIILSKSMAAIANATRVLKA